MNDDMKKNDGFGQEDIFSGGPERQKWNPPGILQLLFRVWQAVFAAAKIAVGAAATVLLILVVCMFAFAGALGDYLQNQIMPNATMDLEGIELDQSSFVYYEDDSGNIQLLQQLYTTVSREWATYDEIPESMIEAAVAIEDKRFFEHQGVDWFTTIKAFANMFLGDDSKGGSTITQQLVKNLTGEDSVTVQRKLEEIFRAVDFERRYSKETVLEWYLNYIYLGNGFYGVKSAAEYYFGKELELLTTAECASLISITNNPSLFDPYGSEFMFSYGGEEAQMTTGRDRNRMRQVFTLGEMLSQGWITQEEYDEAIAQEMVFRSGVADEDRLADCPNTECGYRGQGKTFLEEGEDHFCPVCGTQTLLYGDASLEVYSWFVETVLEDVARDLALRDGITEWNDSIRDAYMIAITRSGLHIYSTLDMDAQNQVDLIYENLDEIPDTRSGQQLQSAIVLIDNETGDIIAMSGGVGEKYDFDAFNRATDASLQTGSAGKPLTVYGPAFQVGAINPATVVKDLPLYYNDTDSSFPLNDNRRYSYSRTIFSAVEDSVNAAAVSVVDLVGTRYSYTFAKEHFRLQGLTDRFVSAGGSIMTDVGYAPLALGAQTIGVHVRDMSAAYATFANDGVYREARTYTSVYDSEGNLILENVQNSEQILSTKAVEYMNYCLVNAVNYGTGVASYINGQVVAGKTGTTGSNFDRWFCGYTDYYTAAVWCGYDTPEPIRLVGDTSNPACRLWRKVMQPLHSGLPAVSLYDRSNFVSVDICLDSGLLATDACRADVRNTGSFDRVESVLVYPEDVPNAYCDCHVRVDYCTEGGGVANEYCQLFAQAGEITLLNRALVRMTQSQIDEIVAAEPVNIWTQFLDDRYVYLIREDGGDGIFHGFHADANEGVESPYIVCQLHTREAWEEYHASHSPSGGAPGGTEEPTEPTVPQAPADPTEPSDVPESTEGTDPQGDFWSFLWPWEW